MAEAGFKKLIAYQLSLIAFQLGWEFVPRYYSKYEDGRQRDQIKQALRSLKQNIVEGTAERSLSSKLKLYDVARASGSEALEDFEDILRFEHLILWSKNDYRLYKLRSLFENCSISSTTTYTSSTSITSRIEEVLGVKEELEVVEIIVNYEIDLLIRVGFFMDKLIQAIETKHATEGGYRENLLRKRLEYRSHG